MFWNPCMFILRLYHMKSGTDIKSSLRFSILWIFPTVLRQWENNSGWTLETDTGSVKQCESEFFTRKKCGWESFAMPLGVENLLEDIQALYPAWETHYSNLQDAGSTWRRTATDLGKIDTSVVHRPGAGFFRLAVHSGAKGTEIIVAEPTII